jgi:hypothetical protein
MRSPPIAKQHQRTVPHPSGLVAWRRRVGATLIFLGAAALLAAAVAGVWFGLTNSPILGKSGAETAAGADLLAAGLPEAILEDTHNCLQGDQPVYRVAQVFREGCDVQPIPSGTDIHLRVEVVATSSLGGEWSGEEPQVVLELTDGPLSLTGQSVGAKSWDTFANAASERIEPWMDVVLPPVDQALEGTVVRGQARMVVGAPYTTSTATYDVSRGSVTRPLQLYVMSPDDYRRLTATVLKLSWQVGLMVIAASVGVVFPIAVYLFWMSHAVAAEGRRGTRGATPRAVNRLMGVGVAVGLIAVVVAVIGWIDICVGDACHTPAP